MQLRSRHPGFGIDDLARAVEGLPPAGEYDVIVKPLRYRGQPHLAAYTEFDDHRITIQIPEPFFAFGEVINYGAKRIAAKGLRFVWLSEGVTFRTRDEVVRYLYCHEWYHWWLYEELGKPSAAETACDRFALRNYLKPVVTLDDARAALRRRPAGG